MCVLYRAALLPGQVYLGIDVLFYLHTLRASEQARPFRERAGAGVGLCLSIFFPDMVSAGWSGQKADRGTNGSNLNEDSKKGGGVFSF